MKQVPPLPGEEGLYQWIGSVLQAAAKDPEIKKVLADTAVASERELISPLFRWRYNGGSVGNGWISIGACWPLRSGEQGFSLKLTSVPLNWDGRFVDLASRIANAFN